MLLIVTFAVGLSVLLNEFSFEKSYREMVASRYEYSLKDMGRGIELSLGLGLDLDQAKNIGPLIRESATEDPYIRSVRVYDDRGRILFSNHKEEVGKKVPASWPGVSGDQHEDLWHREQEDDFVLGYPLFNTFHKYEGTLALSYSRKAVSRVEGHVRRRLLLEALGVLAVSGLLGALVIWVALRDFVRRLARISDGLQSFLETGERRPLAREGERTLEADFDKFQRDIEGVMADLPEPQGEGVRE